MTSRSKDETGTAEAVPGKPASQVEAEAPPDPEVAAAAEAEYESRMSGAGGIAPEEEAAEDKPVRGGDDKS
jgi:hypothetical protein